MQVSQTVIVTSKSNNLKQGGPRLPASRATKIFLCSSRATLELISSKHQARQEGGPTGALHRGP